MTLASSRDTSNGPDWKDIASALLAFQEDNKLDLTISLTVAGTRLKPDLLLEVRDNNLLGDDQEVRPSACVRSRIGRLNVRTLEAAIMSAMYQLDAALAIEFYQAEWNKSEPPPAHSD